MDPKALCLVLNVNFKGCHPVWFHFGNILKMALEMENRLVVARGWGGAGVWDMGAASKRALLWAGRKDSAFWSGLWLQNSVRGIQLHGTSPPPTHIHAHIEKWGALYKVCKVWFPAMHHVGVLVLNLNCTLVKTMSWGEGGSRGPEALENYFYNFLLLYNYSWIQSIKINHIRAAHGNSQGNDTNSAYKS